VRDVWHVRGLPNLDPLLVAVLLLVIIVINTHGAGAAHHQRLRSTPTMVPTSPPTPPPLPTKSIMPSSNHYSAAEPNHFEKHVILIFE